MPTAEWINLVFFSFFMVVSWLRPLTVRARIAIAVIGAIGIILIVVADFADRFLASASVSVVHDWLPAALIPVMYWQAGCFAATLNDRFQRTLQKLDNRFLGNWMQRLTTQRSYRWIFKCLELAYFSCYPLVPLGLGVLYLAHMRRYAAEYWLVVLSATYPCYVFTAFVQTLPPRLLETDPIHAVPSKIRTLNLWIVRRVTTRFNTFPSGHVTATFGGSLVLLRHLPGVGFVFLLVSIGIALGAVTGRYHYAVDVVLGVALAVAVHSLERLFT
ncbi:MAG TPA: phosphatase PAP2 family protein [Pyrinomonadaceae bacterium]